MRLPILAPAVAGALVSVSSAVAAETRSWLGYGHDTQLTNDVASTSITARSAHELTLIWSTKLDGAVVASPLSARVRIGGSMQQVLYVTTEAGSV